jgi:hypothetical protein
MDSCDENRVKTMVTHDGGETAHLGGGKKDLKMVPPLPVIDLIHLCRQPPQLIDQPVGHLELLPLAI